MTMSVLRSRPASLARDLGISGSCGKLCFLRSLAQLPRLCLCTRVAVFVASPPLMLWDSRCHRATCLAGHRHVAYIQRPHLRHVWQPLHIFAVQHWSALPAGSQGLKSIFKIVRCFSVLGLLSSPVSTGFSVALLAAGVLHAACLLSLKYNY